MSGAVEKPGRKMRPGQFAIVGGLRQTPAPGLLAQGFQVQAGAIVLNRHFHLGAANAAVTLMRRSSACRAPPPRRHFHPVVHGVANQVPEGIFESLKDRPVQFHRAAADHQVDLLCFGLGEVAYHAVQALARRSANGSMRTRRTSSSSGPATCSRRRLSPFIDRASRSKVFFRWCRCLEFCRRYTGAAPRHAADNRSGGAADPFRMGWSQLLYQSLPLLLPPLHHFLQVDEIVNVLPRDAPPPVVRRCGRGAHPVFPPKCEAARRKRWIRSASRRR